MSVQPGLGPLPTLNHLHLGLDKMACDHYRHDNSWLYLPGFVHRWSYFKDFRPCFDLNQHGLIAL